MRSTIDRRGVSHAPLPTHVDGPPRTSGANRTLLTGLVTCSSSGAGVRDGWRLTAPRGIRGVLPPLRVPDQPDVQPVVERRGAPPVITTGE
jgi:hypothetical protein